MKPEILIPIIAGSIILIITIVILIVRKARQRRPKEADGEVTPQGETIPKGKSGEKTFDGITYKYKHFRGTDKAPPYFSITIPCESSGAFKIKRESKFDRFFKRMGVTVEIETHDPEFDNTFYIITDTIPFTRYFLERSENRKTIQALFELGFNHLKHDGKSIVLTWNNYPRRQLMPVETVELAVAQLAAPVDNLPKITTYDARESSAWKYKRLFAFVFSSLLGITGLVTLIMGTSSYDPLDFGKVWLFSFKYSLPLFVVFIWIALQLLKGRSSSHSELIIVFIISLFAFPLAGVGYSTYLNGFLDKSPPVEHEVLVTRKYTSKSKNSTNYHMVTETWREGEKEEKFGASRRFYHSIQPYETKLIITTKPGKFGFEWVVGINRLD